MRNCLLFFLIVSFFFSCSNSVKDNSLKKDTLEIFDFKKESAKRLDSSIVSVNTVLPFGCDQLVKHKFPNEWVARDISNPNDSISHPHEKEASEIVKCFNTLNNVKSINLPIINKSEYIKIGDYRNWTFNESSTHILEGCKYRLPDFGKFQCYYVYNNGHHSIKDTIYPNSCDAVGNLILYDVKTKSAKIINIYTLLINEVSEQYRFFYIDNNKDIQIYEVVFNESILNFKKKYIVKVNVNGEMKVESL